MDDKQIQAHVDAIADVLVRKGRAMAQAQIGFESHSSGNVFVRYGKNWSTDRTYEYFFFQDDLPAAIDSAYSWVHARPTLEQERHDQFIRKVGNLLDEAHANGIDAAFVNPLEVLMKQLSENAITHQKGDDFEDIKVGGTD